MTSVNDIPTGYLTTLKTAVVDALQRAFASSFIPQTLRDIHVGIEFPLEPQHYPGIWVNYEDQDSLTIAGIAHREYVYDDPNDPHSPVHEVTRWLFGGEITLTFVALTSRERDALYDQFIRVFAFSRVEQAASDFRTLIETNPFVVIQPNWDELRPHGDGAAPGTPWGTEDEVIYEKSLGFDLEGEFVSDPASNSLVRLAQIIVEAQDEDQAEDSPYVLGIPPAP
jgi:hypothetical protein